MTETYINGIKKMYFSTLWGQQEITEIILEMYAICQLSRCYVTGINSFLCLTHKFYELSKLIPIAN